MDSIYFAVKTYSKFHSGRVAVVRKTWAKLTSKIEFFSDLEGGMMPFSYNFIVLNLFRS